MVVPCRTHLRHVAVAQGALLMSGVFHFAGCDRVYRQCPVVSAVPEALGYQHPPRDYEASNGDEEDGCQTGNLLRHSVDLRLPRFVMPSTLVLYAAIMRGALGR